MQKTFEKVDLEQMIRAIVEQKLTPTTVAVSFMGKVYAITIEDITSSPFPGKVKGEPQPELMEEYEIRDYTK